MQNPIKLLVADDHVLFRQGIIRIISEDPDMLVVGEAASGPEAVKLAKELKPDLVLMDIHMPGGDGVEATQILKRETAVQILILTVSSKDKDLFKALAAGADGYLLKNADVGQLVQAIQQVAAGQGTLSAEVTARVIQAAASSKIKQPSTTLSQRELEILTELAKGSTTDEIAAALFISGNTVKTHVRHILKKLNASNRTEAVARAAKLNLVSSS